MTDISKALAIPGWCADAELRWLAEQAAVANRIVEVGSHLGRSTRAMADATKGKMIAVDDWWGPRDTIIPPKERHKLYQQFGENLFDSPTALDKRLLAWKIDHTHVNPDMVRKTLGEDFTADFIFIDGHHTYEAVKHDISVWLPFLKEGGLICGHDYIPMFPGVVQAVNELLPLATQVTGTTIWQYRKTQ